MLVGSPKVMAEPRGALLADPRFVGEDLLAIIGEPESDVTAGDSSGVAEKRCRFRDMTAVIRRRHEVHEIAGLTGQPAVSRTLVRREQCALAADVLVRRRKPQLVRPARRDASTTGKLRGSRRVRCAIYAKGSSERSGRALVWADDPHRSGDKRGRRFPHGHATHGKPSASGAMDGSHADAAVRDAQRRPRERQTSARSFMPLDPARRPDQRKDD
jgi:hypothetical protein